MQYKCVPAPSELVIDNKGSYDTAVRSFADIINREVNGGWNFHSMENIAVTQRPGCLAALFGQKATTVYFNMLVFSNDKIDNISRKIKTRSTNEKDIVIENSQENNFSQNLEDIKNMDIDEKKFCNNCGQMVNINLKKCSNCGGDDFSQV